MLQQELTGQQWETMFGLANNHAVLSLLYEVFEHNKTVPGDLFEKVQKVSRQVVMQNYKLLYLTNYIVKLLEREAISVIVLKGSGTAVLYPVPELRKSGDVDLLIAKREDLKKACILLEKKHFTIKEKQQSNHHIVLESKDGILIELHMTLAEPFDNQRINDYLRALSTEYHSHIQNIDILGSRLPVPEDAYHAFYLLLHMLHHYLRSGFGLRLLCDWVVFWNREIEAKEIESFVQLTRACGVNGFLEVITGACVHYLGLEEAKVPFYKTESPNKEIIEEFMKEIIEAEEFGKSGNDRMVVMRGTSLIDYVREFHHQMCLNHPKAKTIVIIWPVLWIITLVLFLHNNRKIRQISTMAILRKTKSRSRNRKAMNLFQFQE